MGFKSYRFTEQSDDAWLLDDPQPLRFSGPNGLIAQWYRLHRLELDERPWLVTAHGWLALAFDIEQAESRWIVFEQTEGNVRKYARLERINPMADLSRKGLKQAHGVMVNYLYDLEEIEANHERFMSGEVSAARAVTSLL